jgi:hypothetical protein
VSSELGYCLTFNNLDIHEEENNSSHTPAHVSTIQCSRVGRFTVRFITVMESSRKYAENEKYKMDSKIVERNRRE